MMYSVLSSYSNITQAFKVHMKDILDYRTMEYYRRRYEEQYSNSGNLIELIRSWVPDDGVMDGCDIDLWEMYRDYIDGKREIAQINE